MEERKTNVDLGKYFNRMTIESEIRTMTTLFDSNASGGKRFGLGCTFCYYGYTEEEAFDLIKQYNRWKNFDEKQTRVSLSEAYINKQNRLDSTAGRMCFSSIPAVSHLSKPKIMGRDLFDFFFMVCKPWNICVPSTILEAVLYYQSIGAHILPATKKKTVALREWKIWQDKQPLFKPERFKNGIFLLATDRHSFLDIDLKSEKHLNGIEKGVLMEWYDEIPKGYHCEWSASGGLHVFGQGYMKIKSAEGVKVIGKGSGIATYPTSGYMLPIIGGE